MSWVSLMIGLFLTMVIVLVIVLNTDFFAHNASRMFSRYLFSGTPFSLRVDQLEGNPFKGMKVKGLTVRYESEDFSFDIIRVDEVALRYNMLSLISREPLIDELVLIRPHLWIKPDSSGVNILPGGGGGSRGDLPQLSIRSFEIQNGQVILQGPESANALRNINLTGTVHIFQNEVFLKLDEGGCEDIGRQVCLTTLSGDIRWIQESTLKRGRVIKTNRLLLHKLDIGLDQSHLTLDGIVNPDSMTFQVKVGAEPLDIEEITHTLGIETSHFGDLQGTFIVRGVPDSLHVNGLFNGIFSGYALSGFRADATFERDGITINYCKGEFNGAHVEGKGRYSFEEPDNLDLDIMVRDLNVAKGFIPGRTIPETLFNGHVRFTYFVPDGNIFFQCELGPGHIGEFPFDEASIIGRYAADSLTFSRIFLNATGHTINSHGAISSDGTLRFYFDLLCAPDDTIFAYLDIERYRAGLDVNGICEGTADAWNLRASGVCKQVVYERFVVPEGYMNLAIIKNDAYEVYFNLEGDSCYVDPIGFESIEFSLEYIDEITSIKKLRLSKPDLDAEIRADISVSDDSVLIRFGEVSLLAFDERWIGGGAFEVVIEDSAVRFRDLQLHARHGALYASGMVDRSGDYVEGELAMERVGLELLNRLGIIETPLAGRVKGTVVFSGRRSDPDIRVDLEMADGLLDTLAVDLLMLNAAYSRGKFQIDSLVITAPTGYVEIRGTIENAPIEHLYRDWKPALKRSVINLQSYSRDMYLQPFLVLIGRLPFTGGWLNGTVSLNGPFAHPIVAFDGRIDSLAGSIFRIPSIDVGVRVGGGELSVDGTISIGNGHTGAFRGIVPLARGEWFYSVDGKRPVSYEISMPEGDFADIMNVTDLFAEAEGRFSWNFSVTGTTEHPKLHGLLSVSDADFRLAGMEERFFDVSSTINFEDSLITVVDLKGGEGGKGEFTCEGTIALEGWKPARYDLKIHLDNFLLASIPDVTAILNGDLAVDTNFEGGRVIPVLNGSLEVKKAEVYFEFGDLASAEPRSTMSSPSWVAVIDLEIPGNTWIKTPDASIELQGDITFYRDHRGMYFRGVLDLIRGSYSVYGNKFHLRSGKLEFVHADSFRPVVFVEAETKDPEGKRIYLTLTWHQDDIEPKLALRHEDPGYSETDTWRMLGGSVIGYTGSESQSWDAVGTAQSLAANYIERALNSQMEGVTIEFESGSLSGASSASSWEQQTKIAVGKYLSEGLYVKYKQGLSISTARQIEVEYRISRLFLIRSQFIRLSEEVLRGKSRSSTDEINLDIKIRLEF